MNSRLVLSPLFALSLLSACNSTPPQAAGPDAAPTPTEDPPPAATASADAPIGAESDPAIAESAAPDVPAPEAESDGEAVAEAVPSPGVEVKNIGMHIGGGPNDRETKAPIKNSVDPHMDSFRGCFTKVDDLTKGGDFGVDLRIEREGGKAAVSHPRTALKGEGFKECVVQAFEAIEFQKPKTGATVVSYSLRFTPAK